MRQPVTKFFLKHLPLFFICSFRVAGCITLLFSSAWAADYRFTSPLSAAGLTDQQFEFKVKEYIGIPYRRGGTSKKGMDCSSFTRTVYNRFFDIDLPYSAFGQFKFSGFQNIDENEMQPGDLMFFANNANKRINHVGMYISEGQFIHASSSQGITVSSIDDRYWNKRFVGSKRYIMENSKTDSESLQFEGSLKIPFYEGNAISFFFDTHPLDSPLYLFEIGYEHNFFHDFDVYFSLIHEKFDVFSPGPEFDPDAGDMDYIFDESMFETSEGNGFKIAGDFKPSNWFSIIPSVTYFDFPPEDDNLLNSPHWSFGLNTRVSPINKKWYLSMLLEYSEGGDVISSNSLFNKFSSLEMEIKVGINLTQNLQFSITGTHDRQTAAYGKIPEDSLWMNSAMSDIFMSFDFSY